jgi:CheY-like chemotaxis protein
MTTGPDGGTGGGLSVLFADDNAVLRISVRAILRALGHRIDVVGNGLEAVDAASRADYDVVLLDVQMPVMGGLEAASLIARGRGRRPRIVAVSADAAGVEVDGAFGVDAVLDKPFLLASLARALVGPAGAASRGVGEG